MSMELKDFGMNGQELANVTKQLIKSVLMNLDWNAVEKTFFGLMGDVSDEHRAALQRMFKETVEGYEDFDGQLDDYLRDMDVEGLFTSLLEADDSEEHLKPEPVC